MVVGPDAHQKGVLLALVRLVSPAGRGQDQAGQEEQSKTGGAEHRYSHRSFVASMIPRRVVTVTKKGNGGKMLAHNGSGDAEGKQQQGRSGA